MPTLAPALRLALALLAIALAAYAGIAGPKTVLVIVFVALLPVAMARRAATPREASHRKRPPDADGPIENGRPSSDETHPSGKRS